MSAVTISIPTWLLILCAVIVLIYSLLKIFLQIKGTEIVVPHYEKKSPWIVESKDDKSIVLTTTFDFANEGKSSAMLIDVIARTQLPYEQFDGIEARGRVDTIKYPREDDYFASMIIEHQESLTVKVWITLTARHNFLIDESLAHMVDLPIDFLYETAGRNPCNYSKFQLVLTAEEIAKLAGVTLLKD